MKKKSKPKVPPVGVFKLINGFLNFLRRLQHKIIPPPALLANYTVENLVIQRCLYIAAKLGIAELLKDGAKNIDQIAKAVKADKESLYRLMRTLAGYGFFKELKDGQFELTKLTKPLLADDDSSVLPLVKWVGSENLFGLWVDLEKTIKNGKSYFTNNYKKNYFDWLEDRPVEQEAFNDCLIVYSILSDAFVGNSYDFSKFNTIVDIAGGKGGLIQAILLKNPKLKGIIYELPITVGFLMNSDTFKQAGIADRVEFEEGDFFKSIPAGHDAYIMKSILHDWHEDEAVKILSNCRKAMRDDSKLLIAELVINEGNKPHFSKIIDICMLALNEGRERTPEEYSNLFKKAGLRLNRIFPTSSPYSIIEAVVA